MSLLDKLFPKKKPVCRREMPTWDEVVAHMQDKELSFLSHTIVRTFSSRDKAKRIILLQSDHGYYKAVYQKIRVWDADELNYFAYDLDKYPARWEQPAGISFSHSLFGTEADAIWTIMESPEYKVDFD